MVVMQSILDASYLDNGGRVVRLYRWKLGRYYEKTIFPLTSLGSDSWLTRNVCGRIAIKQVPKAHLAMVTPCWEVSCFVAVVVLAW